MAERYEHLDKAMCKELEKLDKKYMADVEMTEQDLARADKLYHALKSGETFYAMKEAYEDEDEGEYSGENRPMRRGGRSYRRDGGSSYARGRDMRTGRYISRDDGYSGHWNPMDYIDPYWDRRY